MKSISSTVQDLMGPGLGDQLQTQVEDQTDEEKKKALKSFMSPSMQELMAMPTGGR